MTVVGVDLSTFRVNTAWMMRGQPCRWYVDLTGKPKRVLIDRVRAVHMQWPLDVTDVAIEYPIGRSRKTDKALMAIVGAVTRSVPAHARVGWPGTWELREAIGAVRDDKPAAHYALSRLVPPAQIEGWDEHELDALVACLGWQHILNDQ